MQESSWELHLPFMLKHPCVPLLLRALLSLLVLCDVILTRFSPLSLSSPRRPGSTTNRELVDERTLANTNRWRAERGEARISIEDIRSMAGDSSRR